MKPIAFSKRFAYGTDAQPANSRAEIERTLERFGATKIALARDGYRASIMFEYNDRRVRFDLPDPRETLRPYGLGHRESDLEAAHRRLWRSLVMAIKAKLEVVASGIMTFETEFLPYTMVDARRTFAEAAADPAFVAALHAGNLPPMLGPGRGNP